MRVVKSLILTIPETDYSVEEKGNGFVVLRDNVRDWLEIWIAGVHSAGETLIEVDGLTYHFDGIKRETMAKAA